jgi:hypothetical protein
LLTLSASDCPPVVGGAVPCGGNTEFATAHAVLPDTGIDAGSEVVVRFSQQDSSSSGDRSELDVEHAWPSDTLIDPAPDPRVRIVRDDGLVLLDTLATRFDQPTGKFDLPTWLITTWVTSASVRQTYFVGFQNEQLWLELWPANGTTLGTTLGTRVQLTRDTAGFTPTVLCD